jgi:hypothetical protein
MLCSRESNWSDTEGIIVAENGTMCLPACLLVIPSDSQILHEAPKPIDDEALLEYKRRIDRILEDTAELVPFLSLCNYATHVYPELFAQLHLPHLQEAHSRQYKPSSSYTYAFQHFFS